MHVDQHMDTFLYPLHVSSSPCCIEPRAGYSSESPSDVANEHHDTDHVQAGCQGQQTGYPDASTNCSEASAVNRSESFRYAEPSFEAASCWAIQQEAVDDLQAKKLVEFGGVVPISLQVTFDHHFESFPVDVGSGKAAGVEQYLSNVIR
jgi:hypothetical protein